MIGVIGWDARMRNGVLAWEMLDAVDVWFARRRDDVPAMADHPKKRNHFTIEDLKKCSVLIHIEHDYLEERLPDTREIIVAQPESTPAAGMEALALTEYIHRRLDQRGIEARMIRFGMRCPHQSPEMRPVVRTIGHYGAAGRRRPRSGTDLVCEAHHKLPHIELTAIGDDCGLFDHPWHPSAHAVCWSFENRWAAYRSPTADVALQPSRNETMPLTLIEAAMMGKPLIVTDCPAVDELAPWKRLPAAQTPTGLETPVNAVADAMADIYGKPLRDAASETMEHAREKWDHRRFIEELRDFLNP